MIAVAIPPEIVTGGVLFQSYIRAISLPYQDRTLFNKRYLPYSNVLRSFRRSLLRQQKTETSIKKVKLTDPKSFQFDLIIYLHQKAYARCCVNDLPPGRFPPRLLYDAEPC